MAVFDARQGQVFANPVSNFHQGQAIRLGLKAQEKDLELADEKMDIARREMDDRERRTVVDEKTYEQRVKEYEDIVGEKDAKRGAWDLYHGVGNINSQVQSGELSPEDALIEGKAFLERYADSLPESAAEGAQGIRDAIGDRDGLTQEEWAVIGDNAVSAAGYYGFVGQDRPIVLGEGGMLVDSNGNLIRENPRDFAPKDDGALDEDVKPLPTPTRAEEEIIERNVDEVLKNSEVVDKYGMPDSHQDRLRGWVSDESERVQRFYAKRNRAIGFNEAAEIAASDGAKFIVGPEDPGFWSNDDAEFSPPLYRRGDTIPAEQTEDGRPWVVIGYGPKGEVLGEPAGSD